jgi:hypothetical protein
MWLTACPAESEHPETEINFFHETKKPPSKDEGGLSMRKLY